MKFIIKYLYVNLYVLHKTLLICPHNMYNNVVDENGYKFSWSLFEFKSLQVFIFELHFGELVVVFNLKFFKFRIMSEDMILEGLVHV